VALVIAEERLYVRAQTTRKEAKSGSTGVGEEDRTLGRTIYARELPVSVAELRRFAQYLT
jgi:hypothetical protein